MKIKIALIPGEHTNKALDLSSELQKAMEAGLMSVVDQITEELVSLTDNNYSLFLAEEYWHQLIERIRSIDDDFKSDYILIRPQLETIIEAGMTQSFKDVSNIVEQALKTNGIVLQIPEEEEDVGV